MDARLRAVIRHLPNLLSAARLLAAPLAAWCVLAGHDMAALLVFAAAGLSDGLDGAIARRWGVTSRFGAWLDPAADKLLMLLCFVALQLVGVAPWWVVALVILRDAMIVLGSLAAWAAGLALEIRPLAIGKATTLAQVIYVGGLLLLLSLDLSWPRLELAAAATLACFILLSGLAYGLVLARSLGAGRRAA